MHGMLKLGFWGTADVGKVDSESETDKEPEKDDTNDEITPDEDKDDKDDKDNKDNSPPKDAGHQEYVFLSLWLRSFWCRHWQSDPEELDFIFNAICESLPNAIPMLCELADNVQDLLALAQPVRLSLSLIQLNVARSRKLSIWRVEETRKNFSRICMKNPNANAVANYPNEDHGFKNTFTGRLICSRAWVEEYDKNPDLYVIDSHRHNTHVV